MRLRCGVSWTFAGVAIVAAVAGCSESETGGENAAWSVAAAPALTIGELDGPSEYLFQTIVGVRRLADGGVVVADQGASTIRVFDAAGGYLRSIGGRGEGPGEFNRLNHISVLGPDTLLAYDGALYRITRFLVDGSLVETRPLAPEGGWPERYLGTYENGDAALSWIAEAGEGSSVAVPDLMRIGRFGPDGAQQRIVGEAFGMRRYTRGPGPFSPFLLHAFLLRDSVVHTDGLLPSLSVLNGSGETAREITVELPTPDRSEAWTVLREELALRDQLEAMEWIADAAQDDPLPVIAEVLLDTLERFWIKRYEARTDSNLLGGWAGASGGAWTVVERDGSVVAEITLPDSFILHDAGPDWLVGITRDDLGVERVAVYEYESDRQ